MVPPMKRDQTGFYSHFMQEKEKFKLLFGSVTENIDVNVRLCDVCKLISVLTTFIMAWMHVRLALWLLLHIPFFTMLLNRTLNTLIRLI